MDSYAVVWIDETGVVHVGRLELAADRLRLEGAVELEIPYSALAALHVGRRPAERISGRPSLVLDLADGERLRIGSVAGPGTLHEVTERLTAAVAERIPA
jgi:hypothetical protein